MAMASWISIVLLVAALGAAAAAIRLRIQLKRLSEKAAADSERLRQAVAERDREHSAAIHEQKEKERIKKQLTNNINHELKTPVASIQVCLETLLAHDNLPEEKRREFLLRCLSNSERLRSLLADVSLITRMDDGSEAIGMERVDLAKIIAEAVAECEPIASAKGIRLINESDGPAEIRGNASLLFSVIRNLLDNAIAYSGATEIDISRFRRMPGGFSFTVGDNGCGVDSEHLPRLFERFYRIDKGRSRTAGGTGLGLSIVKNAVLLHGGTISVENRAMGGLLFRIFLSED